MEVPLYASPSSLAAMPAQVRCSIARPLAAHCATCSAEQISSMLLLTGLGGSSTLKSKSSCRSAAAVLDVLGSALARPCETGRPMLLLLSQIVASYRRIFTFFRDRSSCNNLVCDNSSTTTTLAPASINNNNNTASSKEMTVNSSRQPPWDHTGSLFTSSASAEHELFARIALDTIEVLACMVRAEVADADLNGRALELLCDILVVGGDEQQQRQQQQQQQEQQGGKRERGGARLPAQHTSKVLRRLAQLVSVHLLDAGGSGGPNSSFGGINCSTDRVQAFSVLLYCLAACGTAADSQCWHDCVRAVRGADSDVTAGDISRSKNLGLVACWHRATSCFARALVDAGKPSNSVVGASSAAAAATSPSRGNTTFGPDSALLFINWCETGRETMPHLGVRWLARSFALLLAFFAPATVHPASAIPVASVYADIAGTLRTAPNLDAGTALRWLGLPVCTACGTTAAMAATATAAPTIMTAGSSPPLTGSSSSISIIAAATASFDLLITSLEALTIIGARFVASEHSETISMWKALTAQTVNSLFPPQQQQQEGAATTVMSASKLDDATRFLRNFHDVVGRCRNHLTWAHIYRHAILNKVIPQVLTISSSGGARGSNSNSGPSNYISEKTWASVAHHLSVAATSDFLWESWAVVAQLGEHVRFNILALDAQRAAIVASAATLVVHARTSHEKPVAVAQVMCDLSASILTALKDRLVPQMVAGTDAEMQLRGVLSLLQCVLLLPWSFLWVESSSSSFSSPALFSSSASRRQQQQQQKQDSRIANETGQEHHDVFLSKLEGADFMKLLTALSNLVDAVVSFLHEKVKGANSPADGDSNSGGGGNRHVSSMMLAVFHWLICITSRVAGLLPPSCQTRGYAIAARIATLGVTVPVTKEGYFLRAVAADLFFQTTVTFAAAGLPDSFADESSFGDQAERVVVLAVGSEKIVSLVQLRNSSGDDRTTIIIAFVRSPYGRSAFKFRQMLPVWPPVPTKSSFSSSSSSSGSANATNTTSTSSSGKSVARQQDPLAATSREDTRSPASGQPAAPDENDLEDVLFSRRVKLSLDSPPVVAPASVSSTSPTKQQQQQQQRQAIEDRYPLLRLLAREFTLQASTNWKLLAFNPGLAAQLRGLDRSSEHLAEMVVPIECAPLWWAPPADQCIDMARRQQRFEAFLGALGAMVRTAGAKVYEFRCNKRGAVLRFVLPDSAVPGGSACDGGNEFVSLNNINNTSGKFPIVLRFGEPDAAPLPFDSGSGGPISSPTTGREMNKQQQQQIPKTNSTSVANATTTSKGRPAPTPQTPTTTTTPTQFSVTAFGTGGAASPIRIGVTPVEGCGLFALKFNNTVTRNVGKTGVAMELAASASLVRDLCMLHFAEQIQPIVLVAKREAMRRVISTADSFRDGAPLGASAANVICELMHQSEVQCSS